MGQQHSAKHGKAWTDIAKLSDIQQNFYKY